MARANGQLRDDELRAAISKLAGAAGFDVEDVTVRLDGGRRLVRAVVDRDGGVDLDTAAGLSRAIADALDTEYDEVLGDAAYTLEITSRGIGAPLTALRHFRRAAGRLATIALSDGRVISARIALADDTTLTVLTGRDGTVPMRIPRGEIGSAKVEAEFSAPSSVVREALVALGAHPPAQSAAGAEAGSATAADNVHGTAEAVASTCDAAGSKGDDAR